MRHTQILLKFDSSEMDDAQNALYIHWRALAKAVDIALKLDNDEFVCWTGTFISSPGNGNQGVDLVGSAEVSEERKVSRIATGFLNFDSQKAMMQKSRNVCRYCLCMRDNQLKIERPQSSTLDEAVAQICAELRS